jgi:hypothetical protein
MQRHYTDSKVIHDMADCIDALATAQDKDVHEVLNDYIAEHDMEPVFVVMLCERFMPEDNIAGFIRRVK